MTSFLTASLTFLALFLVFIEMRLIAFQSSFYHWLGDLKEEKKFSLKDYYLLRQMDDDISENYKSFYRASIRLIQISLFILVLILILDSSSRTSDGGNYILDLLHGIDSVIFHSIIDVRHCSYEAHKKSCSEFPVFASPLFHIVFFVEFIRWQIEYFKFTAPFQADKLEQDLQNRVQREIDKYLNSINEMT